MKNTNKRLVSILLCLAMVLAVLPMAVSAEATTTVYYYNASNWETVSVYWWGSADTNPGWPGNAMTDLGNGYWSYEIPSDLAGKEGVIFNNTSGAQTSNLTLPTTGENCFDGSNWIVYTGEAIEVVIDYYLRGDMNGWDTSAKMTDNGDGTYSITMDLTAGTYEYKAAIADWSWSCPSASNASITLEADDTVTFTLDVAANTLTYTLASGIVVPPVEYDYYVAGSAGLCGVEWDPAQNLMASDGENLYTITFANVEAGSYEFKVTTGSWDTPAYGNNGENYAITVEALSNVTITFNAETTEITVDIAAVPQSIVPEALVIGENYFEIAAGDTNALTATYTATEAGTLIIGAASMSTYDDYAGAWGEVPPAYIGMQFGRMYALTVNGMNCYSLPVEIDVAAGDEVTVGIQSFMGTATKLSLKLAMRDIKWQLKSDATAEDETVDLRLISYITGEPTDYSAVTFNVTINGETAQLACTKVYSAINANGTPIAADAMFDGAAYLVTYILEGVPADYYYSPIEVSVSWTDLEGNVTTSDETRTIIIADNWA